MNFRNQYNNNVKPKTNPGSYLKTTYMLGHAENGDLTLIETGKTDLYKQIQSHRESTDLSIILSRIDSASVNGMMHSYQFEDILTGDIVDVFNMPKNPGDALNLAKRGEELFKGLSVDIREAFDNSSYKFISSFGTKEFMDKINYLAHKYMNIAPDDAVVLKKGTKIIKNPDIQTKGGVNDAQEE